MTALTTKNSCSPDHLSGPEGALGCRADATTGLIYMRQRWYDPTLQRFISRDPLRSANRYAYCLNNPTNYVDPSGLVPVVQMTCKGKKSIPTVFIKNPDQVAAFDKDKCGNKRKINSRVPILVPPDVVKFGLENFMDTQWNSSDLMKSPRFANYWAPRGNHDWKRYDVRYDAFGNFAYGVSGRAYGFTGTDLQEKAELLQKMRGGTQPLQNIQDIQAGIDAYDSGCTFQIVDSSSFDW
jgi:RHS repeat-associated protein